MSGEVDKSLQTNDSLNAIEALRIASAQIAMSMGESTHSMDQLVQIVIEASQNVQIIQQQLEAQTETASNTDNEHLQLPAKQALSLLQQATTAMQFYDRLTQRLQHVKESLDAVTNVIEAPNPQHSLMWEKLQEKMRSVYSLEQEQHIVEALLQKRANSSNDVLPAKPSNDIELF